MNMLCRWNYAGSFNSLLMRFKMWSFMFMLNSLCIFQFSFNEILEIYIYPNLPNPSFNSLLMRFLKYMGIGVSVSVENFQFSFNEIRQSFREAIRVSFPTFNSLLMRFFFHLFWHAKKGFQSFNSLLMRFIIRL